jgi:hypothetical protein
MLTAREHENALNPVYAPLSPASRWDDPRLSRLSLEDLASRIGMSFARFMGEEDKRLAFTAQRERNADFD